MHRPGIRTAHVAALAALAAAAARERRRRAEAERRRSEVVRAQEVRTRWLAGLSHELRTPLSAMISFSQLLAEDPLQDARDEHSACVRSCGEHLLELLDDLRDLAALDSGALRLAPRPTDPGAIGRECLRVLEPEALACGVRLRFQPPATPELLLLDPTRLRQVLLNYLDNAIRFTDPGGTVTLALRRVGDRLQAAVSDTGAGIAGADQPHVFDERFQAGGAGRGGSGLGLAIVRRLVQAQGGEVAVASRPGLGSTFYAWLPWIPAGAPEAEPARPAALAGADR